MAVTTEAPLGTGIAERGRKTLKGRKRRLDQLLDESGASASPSLFGGATRTASIFDAPEIGALDDRLNIAAKSTSKLPLGSGIAEQGRKTIKGRRRQLDKLLEEAGA